MVIYCSCAGTRFLKKKKRALPCGHEYTVSTSVAAKILFQIKQKIPLFHPFSSRFELKLKYICNMNRSLCFEDKKMPRNWVPLISRKTTCCSESVFLLKSNKTCISDGGFMYMNCSLCFSNSSKICQNMLTLHENTYRHRHICIYRITDRMLQLLLHYKKRQKLCDTEKES